VKRFTALITCFIVVLQTAAVADAVDFVTQIKPILASRCYPCHSALKQESGLRLDTAALAIAGGDSGAAVLPGNSAESLLVQMLTGELGSRMPPEDEGEPLHESQIALITKWIDAGASAPAEPIPPDPREHWAYRVPVRQPVPKAANPLWNTNPIDAFLAANHQSHGITPSAAAAKNVLLRRVYLDLIGLPPTPEELAEFLADESPAAYETVVDRLLASPQYGERWARHWMDVWRYSDWSGYKEEVRNSARHMWRWRDWIVESLNADTGYDQMVQAMLAGDELAPTNESTLRATGFLARNWYKFNRNTWLDNTVEHTSKAFLGVTMNCCRCHDHKYDPISQVEYFQMRAIFEPHDVRTDRVPGQSDVAKDGMARVCDLKPETPTYLLDRGDELRPDKDHPIQPDVPAAIGDALNVTPIELPLTAYYPALREFAIKDDLSNAARNVADRETALVEAQKSVAAEKLKSEAQTAQENEVPAARKGETPAELIVAQAEAGKSAAATSPPQVSPAQNVTLAAAVEAAELVAKQLATARAAHASLAARVAAEKAKHGLSPSEDSARLATFAAKAEREFALCQAQAQQATATKELAAAQAALNPQDEATKAAVTAAEKKLAESPAAIAAAHAALAEPGSNYTPLGEQSPKTSTGRRLAFARWITDRNNPLTARVAVNHIWLRHFGAPLIENMFDFGLRSPAPLNQPLLDWLAVELMDQNWQMKHIHRLLVTSNAYRMKSAVVNETLANQELDRDNRFLWRMNSRRLEAEAVRDSLIRTAGNLDLTLGGPELDRQAAFTTLRRSIYFRHAFEKEVKFLQLFDGASVNECYRRSESVVPQQALALSNSELSLDQSRQLAKKLSQTAASDAMPDDAFIRLAFKQILCREPSADELAECRAYLAAQATLLQHPEKLTIVAGGPKASVAPASDPKQRARENLTHVLFNHNDFVTIR
jgi:hypothetical protein